MPLTEAQRRNIRTQRDNFLAVLDSLKPPSPDQADEAWGSYKTDDEDARKYKGTGEGD